MEFIHILKKMMYHTMLVLFQKFKVVLIKEPINAILHINISKRKILTSHV